MAVAGGSVSDGEKVGESIAGIGVDGISIVIRANDEQLLNNRSKINAIIFLADSSM